MPSLAEGFGLPVLEAAACGCPALASATSALAEAAVTSLATFDPSSSDDISNAIDKALTDEQRRATIVQAQAELATRSTWAAVADRTIAAVDRMAKHVDDRRWRPGKKSPRVALVGPLPPYGGGLGVYGSRLLPALHDRTRLDAVTSTIERPALPTGVGHVPAAAFGSTVRPAGFDAVIYALGNSDGHRATVELSSRYPGWLWLHEVRLPALATTALEDASDEEYQRQMESILERAYPGRAPRDSARRAGRSSLELTEAGIGLTGLLVPRSRGVLVNSEVARRLLLLDLPPLSHRPPVHVLPPACPSPVRSPRTSISSNEPLIVALGVVSMAKRPDVLVDIVALMSAQRPCRLAFVGPCPPFLAEVIRDRARIRGVSDLIDVIGSVDDASWGEWCDRAALAVQLRDTPSGETSAAVLEALSRGIPVVTNMATAGDYPPGTVALVDSLSPVALAERLLHLLEDPATQADMADAGLEFAGNHQFGHLADALLAAVLG
jgi:glycosyltransferase involved in cell wall biosynthesis